MAVKRLLLILIPLCTFFLHLFYATKQGYFSDELYFIDCSKHLSFGYFDPGPLLPLLARVSQFFPGEGPLALRLFSALGHAGAVFISGLIAAELGGGVFAQGLSCLCVSAAPGFLMLGGLFITPSLEPLLWTLFSYYVLLAITRAQPRFWCGAGIALGLGFLNKPSMLLLAFSLILAFALVSRSSRRVLCNKFFVLSLFLALVIALPNLLWQIGHDWNMFAFMQSVRRSVLVKEIGAPGLLLAPVFALNPLNALLWLGGLYFLGFRAENRALRAFAWAYPILVATLWIVSGKPYYIAGYYPLLFAAGAVFAEKSIKRFHREWIAAVLVLEVATSALLLPLSLPILSRERTEQYATDLHLWSVADVLQTRGVRRDAEGTERDRYLSSLGAAYSRLSGSGAITLLVSHYFQASWIDIEGKRYGLPEAISGNSSYYNWGPGLETGNVTLAVGFSEGFLRSVFGEVTEVAEFPEAKVCKRPRAPLTEIWTEFRSVPF
jgi:4-amino-4-deoxy-L-arabinose transferase-like glycosyltransferase